LLLVPAAAMMLGRRPPQWTVLLLTLGVGWLTATYVALTMHGYWWPGRQLVVVLPVAVLVIVWFVSQLPGLGRGLSAAAATWGAVLYAVVVRHGWSGDTTWVAAPDRADLHSPLAWLFPDNRVLADSDVIRYVLWSAAAVSIAVACWRRGSHQRLWRTIDDPPAPVAAESRTSG
jgi:hypothetical protein